MAINYNCAKKKNKPTAKSKYNDTSLYTESSNFSNIFAPKIDKGANE
jgi:hypothetical protein